MSTKLPYINILQSAMAIPPSDTQPIALDIKILPDENIPAEPFFGVWLVDISGSMAGDRLKNAKESLKEQVKKLPDGTIFNLVTFETDVHEIMSMVKLDNKSRQDIIKELDKLSDRGTTALYGALQKGVELMRNYTRSGGNLKVKKIYLMSDGDPTDVQVQAKNENDPNYKKYFTLAQEALEYKSSIDTIGALGEHNVYLLYEIAKRSTGKYIFAEDEEELKTKMIIATEQTVRIAYSQPHITVKGLLGGVQLSDMAQYTPTVIRMPFEKINDKEAKAYLRSFEAGDTYQILIKGTLDIDTSKIQMDAVNKIMELEFDFGEGLTVTKEIMVKYTQDQSKFKLNQDINRKYANVFTQAEEISDCTIRGDAGGTIRIQGDETKKISN